MNVQRDPPAGGERPNYQNQSHFSFELRYLKINFLITFAKNYAGMIRPGKPTL